MAFLDDIEPLKQTALAELNAAPDLAALEQTKGAWTGPNGRFTALMKQLGTLSKEEKPAAGKLINAAKVALEAALLARREELELKAALPSTPTDFTLPGRRRALGKLHPLTQVTDDIVRAFRKIGFAVADGPEIEDEYHCFDALNTPADHPARDSQDTFYLPASPGQGGHAANRAGCCAPTPPPCKSASWKNSRRRSASSCPAACTGAIMPTPRTTPPSTRSKAFMWTNMSRWAISRVPWNLSSAN